MDRRGESLIRPFSLAVVLHALIIGSFFIAMAPEANTVSPPQVQVIQATALSFAPSEAVMITLSWTAIGLAGPRPGKSACQATFVFAAISNVVGNLPSATLLCVVPRNCNQSAPQISGKATSTVNKTNRRCIVSSP